ncbi:MAG: TonB-dependent receptor [Pseudomonadota bacterium]
MNGLKSILYISAAAACLSTAPASAKNESDGLEVIIVNAQRRAETLQEVPVAVSAFSGEDLTSSGVFSFNDIETLVPSLEIESAFGGGQPQIRLRGVGFDDYAANNTPTVGIYVDEVAYPFPIMSQAALFDLQQVEVLRGPQGTLYGRNTTGGAVNFITNKPTEELTAGLRTEFGNRERWQAEAFISGSLDERVKARLAVITEQGGAWQFDREDGEELGDADRTAARAMVDVDFDELQIRLTGHYYYDKSDGVGAYLLAPYVTNGFGTLQPDTNTRATGWGVSAAFAAETGLSEGDAPFRDNEGYGLNARIDYDFGSMTLTSLTSYESLDRREFNDWDGTAVPAAETLFNSEPRVFAQEVRLASNPDTDSPLTWIVGGYYSDEELTELYQSDFQDSFGLTARTPYRQEARTLAIFGQADYQITEKLSATLGLRYEDENRDLVSLSTTGIVPVDPPLELLFVNSEPREADLSQVSGKASVQYQLSSRSLLYGSISRGVKSGGFTAFNTLSPPQTAPFSHERLWAFEIGSKNDLIDDTLRVNVAAFYYDYRDQQIQGFVVDPTFAAVGRTINVPSSRIFGFELETVWTPVDGVTLSNAIGWKKGEFQEFQDVDLANSDLDCPCSPAFIDRSGEDLPNIAPWSYVGSLQVIQPVVDGWTLQFDGNWTYRDSIDRTRLGSEIFSLESFWLVNAQVSVGPEDGLWQFGVFARNLTNTDYDETRNFFISDANGNFVANGYRGRPRTYGLRFAIRY